jgi:hypothetical protein
MCSAANMRQASHDETDKMEPSRFLIWIGTPITT